MTYLTVSSHRTLSTHWYRWLWPKSYFLSLFFLLFLCSVKLLRNYRRLWPKSSGFSLFFLLFLCWVKLLRNYRRLWPKFSVFSFFFFICIVLSQTFKKLQSQNGNQSWLHRAWCPTPRWRLSSWKATTSVETRWYLYLQSLKDIPEEIYQEKRPTGWCFQLR